MPPRPRDHAVAAERGVFLLLVLLLFCFLRFLFTTSEVGR